MKKIATSNIISARQVEARYPLALYKSTEIATWDQQKLLDIFASTVQWRKDTMDSLQYHLGENGNDEMLKHHLDLSKQITQTLAVLRVAKHNIR